MQNTPSHHHVPLLASILMVLMGIGVFAQMWVSGAFAIQVPGFTITSPTTGSTLYWGQENLSIQFTAPVGFESVKIELSQGGMASQQDEAIFFVLDNDCRVDANQAVQNCVVNIPNKPADGVDGGNYFILLTQTGNLGTDGVVGQAVVGVTMATHPIDFSYDLAKGIQGFEFSPLVFDKTVKTPVEVGVWVKYTDADGKDSSATTLNVSAGFGDSSSNWAEVDDIQVLIPAGIAPGSSVLINLGTFEGDSYLWNFKLQIDPQNIISESSESNNDYFGEVGDNSKEPIDLNGAGATFYLGVSPTTIGVGQSTTAELMISAPVLPAGTLLGFGQATIVYDQTKLSIDPESWVQSSGIINTDVHIDNLGEVIVDFEISSVNYPSGDPISIGTLDFLGLDSGTAQIQIKYTPMGQLGDGNDLILQNEDGARLDDFGDVFSHMSGNVYEVTITGIAKELSASYFSQKFPVTTSGQRLSSWNNFRAVYNDQLSTQGLTTDTKFALGFFNANGVNVCTISGNVCGTPLFDTDGYFLVPVEKSYNAIDPTTGEVNIAILNGFSWKDQVRSVQIRVDMYTSNHYGPASAQPWVESVNVGYSADLLGEVGLIHSGNSVVNVARGASASYTFQIDRSDDTFGDGVSCPVSWSIVSGSTTSDISWSPASGNVTIDDTNPSQSITATVTATSSAVLNTPYPFTIQAITCDTQKVFRSLNIGVNVTGGGSAPFTLSMTPAVSDINPGQSVTFSVSATRQTGFTNSILLSDNIASIFGDDIASITYNPTTKTIASGSTGPVTITVQAASANTSPTVRTITVTGTSGSDSSGTSSQLSIGNGANLKDITLELTVPVEGGQDATQPIYSFRLYTQTGNTKAFEKTDLRTTNEKVTVSIEDLTIGGVYRGFVRSTRHLWREASGTITVSASQSAYTMSFIKLLAGDIDPNNVVNAVDVPVLTRDWGKTGTGLIPDFNADQAVNALDIVSIVSNWFKTGSTLPN